LDISYPPISGRAWDAALKLSQEFPTVATTDIAGVLIDARRAVDLFGMSRDEELAMAEKIARERLRQQTAEPADVLHLPRLDPETHRRRTSKG
jgi:hypothetical protein